MKNISLFLIFAAITIILFFKINLLTIVLPTVSIFIIAVVGWHFYKKYCLYKALKFIDNYQFPEKVIFKFKEIYFVEDENIHINEIKSFFKQYITHDLFPRNSISVTLSNQSIELWKLFYSCSRPYRIFCLEAFGEMIEVNQSSYHMTPLEFRDEKI